jgi:predicted phage-related endonuclease
MIAPVKLQNEQEWLGRKVKRIGSSDARAILGFGYEGESSQTVYDRMVHGIKPVFSHQTIELMNEGKVMESAILQLFAAKNTDWIVQPTEGFSLTLNDDYPDLCCTVDAIATHRTTGERIVVEAKNEQFGKFETYDDDKCPVKHYLQVQHQLICTGFSGGFVAALVRGKFVQRWIPRDNDLIEQMLLAYSEFMDCVRNGRPPSGVESMGYREVQVQSDRMLARYLGKSASDAVREAKQLQDLIDVSEKKLKRLKASIAESAKGCGYLVLDDQQVFQLGRSKAVESRVRLPRGVQFVGVEQ